MKKLVNSIFPYFDTKALDAARFFFGTSAADVAIYPDRMNLTEFLEEDLFWFVDEFHIEFACNRFIKSNYMLRIL